jgi:iron-sulfur cluster repair protein YtfE (RIC family)
MSANTDEMTANTDGIDLETLLDDIVASHHKPLRSQVARIDSIVRDMTDYGEPDDPVLLEIRQLVEGLCACVESQLSTERNVVFPMLRRIRQQTLVSKCHAGMIRSRLAIVERDLARIRGVMIRLRDLGAGIASPAGCCEACHELMRVAREAISNLQRLSEKQSDVLFAWAIARERSLVG